MSTTLVAIFSQLRPISPASRRRRLPSPRPCLMLILSISSRCLPPQVWAGCPQLPAALHLGERLGDSAWPSYHLLVSTKAAARLPVGPAAASSLPPPGFLQDRPAFAFMLCSGTSPPPSPGLVPTPRHLFRPVVSMLGNFSFSFHLPFVLIRLSAAQFSNFLLTSFTSILFCAGYQSLSCKMAG